MATARQPIRAKLTKPNEALVMMPRSGRLTAVGRKLYNVMLHHAQAKLQQGRAHEATDYFEAPLRHLLEPVTGGGDANYRALAKQYLIEMQDVTMEWDSPELSAGGEWKRLKLLSEVVVVKRAGELWVRWALPPTLVKGLTDPLRWTSLELAVMSRLTTYAAVALYEICARYKNNPSGVTGHNLVSWWIDALSNSAPPLDASGLPKRREWRKFKHEFVGPAIEQINQHTDLEVELIEIRQGRNVSEVQFAVRKKLMRPDPAALPLPVNADLLERAQRAGISDAEVDTLQRRYSADQLRTALVKLEQRLGMPHVDEVRSPVAYLQFLLQRDAESPAEAPLPPPQVVSTSSPGQPAASGMPRAAARSTSATPLTQTRRKEVTEKLMQLGSEEQRKLLSEVVEELRAKQLLTPSIARRIAQGDWMAPGILQSKMVDLYAERYLGPDWSWEAQPTDEPQLPLRSTEPIS